MEFPLYKVRKVLKIAKEPISLETPIGEEEDSHLGDFIEDKRVTSPVDAVINLNLSEQTRKVLSTLTPREEKVLRMRFGIGEKADHTLEEVGQDFAVTGPHRVWVSDITYIPTDEGWLYLAGHKDLFSKELVGYALGDRITKDLVEKSLLRAGAVKRPPKGLIHHSDRGSQYCSSSYRKLLDRFGMVGTSWTIVIDRKGIVRFNGFTPADSKTIVALVHDLRK